MDEIYERYKDNIEFLCVYIREAHPEDNVRGVRAQVNANEGILINQHTTIEERAEAAQICVLRLNLKMPMALDPMTDQVDLAYRAMPERLVVVDADGVIDFISGAGPWGFIPDDWEEAIKRIV